MIDIYAKGPVRIRSSVAGDIMVLKDRLRESDRLEIAASHNQSPYEALSFGLRHSTFCATIIYAGEPVAMFGVVPDEKLAKMGTVWLLATDDIYKMRWTFLKLTKRYIKFMQNRYPLLYNFLDVRNQVTEKWLLWAGAQLSDPRPYGIHNLPFRYFTFGGASIHTPQGGY